MKRVAEPNQFDRETDSVGTLPPESQIAIPGLGRLRTGVHHPNAHDTGVSAKPKLELVNQK
jgi:hypothetical protein